MGRKPSNKFLAFSLALLLASIFAREASSTTVIPMDTGDLSEKASVIVVGTCTSNESTVESRTGRIFTLTSFKVSQVVKGSVQDTVTVRLPGGRDGGTVTIIPGVPVFPVGEEVVLFLTAPAQSGYPGLIGLDQGSYPVSVDQQSGKKVVRGVSGNHAKGRDEAMKRSGSLGLRTLDSFIQEIKSHLR